MRLKVNRARKSVPKTLIAPIGGLNGRDGLADMDARDAFVLDNWFPGNTTVDSRGGSLDHVTGINSPVETLAVYAGGATSKMLAFAGGKIYNVSITGAVGAALQSGRASNIVSTCMFSNAGSQFLLGVSGADVMFSYDGTTVSNLVITGLTGSASTLHCVFAFKGRVYLAQKDQLGFYYLATGAIQGAASYFDLAQVAKNGGYLLGIASFSSDSGSGPADYMVFMTSQNEYIVYSGTDPSNAATWVLVGRYYSPSPIGRKGWFNFRSDLYVICDEGVVAFSQIRSAGDDGAEKKYLSSKLGGYITDLAINRDAHGWHGVAYPRGNQLLVNIPATSTSAGAYYQFAMNTDTNEWGRFKGLNALSMVVFNERLYFGTYAGRVVLADEGHLDNGAEIVCDARQAHNYFDDGRGMGDADKQFHFAVFIIQSEGEPSVASALTVNFEDEEPVLVSVPAAIGGSEWDVSEWDTSPWAGSESIQNLSVPFGEIGYVASVWLRASTLGSALKWYATRIILQKTQGMVLQ